MSSEPEARRELPALGIISLAAGSFCLLALFVIPDLYPVWACLSMLAFLVGLLGALNNLARKRRSLLGLLGMAVCGLTMVLIKHLVVPAYSGRW
jgi:hypothetical protein